jgi:pilus assembly protein CpaF
MHTKTRYSDGGMQNVDARLLVRDGLRCDPDIIVPSEMRGAEAMDVLEAARTGHTLASTFHAKNAKEAYSRIVTMAMMAGTALSEDMLLTLAYQAFPIICHKRRLADGSRKYVEICEAVETENGHIVVPLFKFVVENNRYGQDGNLLEIRGRHVKINPISDALADTLLLGGAQWKDIRRFARDGYQPERGAA